ncbi:MAG: hypothetical protein O3A46_13045, partial [Candidatus Poribacteria bacterium]|nr:hypothetical protein [Candidatus Poribacteria bacterium]
ALSYLVGILVHPFWRATIENDYASLFHHHIPDWFTVRDTSVLKGYFEGESSLFAPHHLSAWAIPILTWSVFISVLWFYLLCLNALFRRQWTESEKLSYPITALPLEMAQNPSFFKSRALWMSFGTVFAIQMLNSLNYYYPSVPSLKLLKVDISPFFKEKPWNTIDTTFIAFYPFIIGLTFLIPLDLAFSSWFFYLFGKVQRVAGEAVGWHWKPGYLDSQSQGAWLVFGLVAIWAARRHLKSVARDLFRPNRELDDTDEAMPYRVAVWGAFGAMVFLIAFSLYAGMTLFAAVLFFGLLTVMAIALTKIRAQLGPPVHEIVHVVNPRGVMVSVLGTRFLGGNNLTVMSFLYWFNRCNRAHPMPNQLEALWIAEKGKINKRDMTMVLAGTAVIAVVLTFVMELDTLYRFGASRVQGFVNWIGFESFGQLQLHLHSAADPAADEIAFIGVGAAFTAFLSFMKLRYLWWPFHPAGYVLSGGSWGGMTYIWAPALVTSVIKFLILTSGGLGLYRKAVPVFMGLVLGDYAVSCLWTLIGIALKIPVYGGWE